VNLKVNKNGCFHSFGNFVPAPSIKFQAPKQEIKDKNGNFKKITWPVNDGCRD